MTREGPPIEIVASPGTVEVQLPETPTSGYLWQLLDPPPGVHEHGREYQQAGPVVAGGSGSRVFRFEITEPGRRELVFLLQRPWERQPIERRSVTVTTLPP